jgi:hypothetical protein
MTEGCAQQEQLLSHQGPSKILPGGFPIHDRFEGDSGNPEENQGLEPTNCDGRKSPSTTRSAPIQGGILETPELQREEYPFKTPKEYREEQSMAQSNLRRNGTPWEIPSRNLSTPGERENQPSKPLHGGRPLNICTSSTRSSSSDSKYSQITSKKSELLSSDYSTPQIPHENIPIDISLRRSVNMFTENMNFLVLHTLKNNKKITKDMSKLCRKMEGSCNKRVDEEDNNSIYIRDKILIMETGLSLLHTEIPQMLEKLEAQTT